MKYTVGQKIKSTYWAGVYKPNISMIQVKKVVE